MSLPINIAINIHQGFLKSCFGMSKTTVSYSPPEGLLTSPTSLDPPTDTFVSSTTGVGSKANLIAKDDWSRLTDFYPNAITNFYGSGTPCVFKMGPGWFSDIQVAFIESVYCSHRTGPKLMSLNPMFDLEGLPALCKPFMPTLGLSIVPLKSPYYECKSS